MNTYISPVWKWGRYWYIPCHTFIKDHKVPSLVSNQFKNPLHSVSNKWSYRLSFYIHQIRVIILHHSAATTYYTSFLSISEEKLACTLSTIESTCVLGLLPFCLFWDFMPSVTSSLFYLLYFPSSASSPSAHDITQTYLSIFLSFHLMASQYWLEERVYSLIWLSEHNIMWPQPTFLSSKTHFSLA